MHRPSSVQATIFVPATSTSSDASRLGKDPITVSSLTIPLSSHNTPPLPTLSSFNANAPTFTPRPLSQSHDLPPRAPPTQPSKSNANTKKRKSPIPTLPEAIEIEFLKIQINVAQNKIVDLENKLDNKQKSNTILTQRLKTMEDGFQNQTFQQ